MPNTSTHRVAQNRARRQPVNHSGSSLKKISSWPWCPFSTTWGASHRAYRGNELKLSPWKDMESDFLLVLKKSHPMSKNATRLSVAEHLVAAWWFSRPHRCFTIWNPPSKIKHLKQIKRIMKPLLYFNIFTNKVL